MGPERKITHTRYFLEENAIKYVETTFWKISDSRWLAPGDDRLSAGGDLGAPQNMTLAGATSWCGANESCSGFTAQVGSGGCAASTSTLYKVYFKAAIGGQPNIDKTWVSYGKSTKPCVVLSRYDYWSAPPTVTLGPGGRTIVLSGMAGRVESVRMNWRAYPCEHLSCGVYAKKENLPPAPFWAEVTHAAADVEQ